MYVSKKRLVSRISKNSYTPMRKLDGLVFKIGTSKSTFKGLKHEKCSNVNMDMQIKAKIRFQYILT